MKLKTILNLLQESIILEDANEELKKILRQDYETFVSKLGSSIQDKKFLQAVKQLNDKYGTVKIQSMGIKCTNLKPTQNEVAMSNSLDFPLKSPSDADKYLKGGTVTIKGPIVTAGDGKYIIDGHHRWSQLFVFNPKASISAENLSDLKNPIDALKATQLGIAASSGEVHTQPAKGINLFTVNQNKFNNHVKQIITKDVMKIFVKHGIAESESDINNVLNYLWGNVVLMRKTSQPVKGAPKRDVMPQTDKAPGWDNETPAEI